MGASPLILRILPGNDRINSCSDGSDPLSPRRFKHKLFLLPPPLISVVLFSAPFLLPLEQGSVIFVASYRLPAKVLLCSEFLRQIRKITDELAFIGSPVSDDDLAVLNGLGLDYNSFIVAAATASRNDPLTFLPAAFYTRALLLTGLTRDQTRSATRVQIPPTKAHAQVSPFLLGLLLHLDLGLLYHLIKAHGLINSKTLPSPAKSVLNRATEFQAFTAQPFSSSPTVDDWILYSGATNHVTSDLNNLSSFYDYTESDSLQIRNCVGLPIQHIGPCSLSFSSHSLHLTDVLHVSTFSKISLVYLVYYGIIQIY